MDRDHSDLVFSGAERRRTNLVIVPHWCWMLDVMDNLPKRVGVDVDMFVPAHSDDVPYEEETEHIISEPRHTLFHCASFHLIPGS